MEKKTCSILGYGDRSSKYSKYALDYPEELEVVAVIDIAEHKLKLAKEVFNLTEDALFNNLDEFLAKDIKCDFVINGTMDSLHYETSIKLLNKGYNLLLEKPITANVNELLKIQDLANKKNLRVVVCHVLRYTMFYSKIKEVIASGVIGKVVNIQMNEHVWHGHFINAYVRGKWRSEKECGSGLLLAKCCHDTDLLCWLNSDTEPVSVSSFGSRSLYAPKNAPEGATEYCYNCPKQSQCVFNAMDFELNKDYCPQYTWADINKPIDQITHEEKIEFLKKDSYGKCVYKTDMDIVDRQCVSVEYENGSISTLNMVGGATIAGRHIHIIGEMGEIVGYIEENKFVVRKFFACDREEQLKQNQEVYDLDKLYILETKDQSVTGHYGGDFFIMKDLLKLLRGEGGSLATTDINDSVKGHLVCYAAEIARKEKRVVSINELK
ncbi:MAG: Gfo/Idh/MocA family oxidoreductase [Clostridiales bacterium]|nr:Gfo/Idh/MocA family oxidoreductase [Clostridiales bacterium]